MNFSIDLNTLLSGIILLVLGAGVKGLFVMKDGIARVHTKIGKVETWTEQHEKTDDYRFEAVAESLKTIEGRLK